MISLLLSIKDQLAFWYHLYVAEWYWNLCVYTKTMIGAHAVAMTLALFLVMTLALGRFKWWPFRIILK